jgi:RNA polymerase sigma-70 factor (sigma-E family)
MDERLDGFDAFVRSRTAGLLRFGYLLTGDQHAAEDLVQSALMRVGRRWNQLRSREYPDAYVRTTMYRLAVTGWRARRVREVLTRSPPDLGNPPTLQDDVDLRLLLQRALLELPVGQRTVLVLRYFEDWTEAETARAMGVSVGTVKSQAHRALAALRANSAELSSAIAAEAESNV